MRNSYLRIFLIFMFFSISLLYGTSTLSDEPEECTFLFSWTHPTIGTPVDRYIVEADINGTGFREFTKTCPDTFYYFTQPHGTSIKVRVAGVDAQNRQGPFSRSSLVSVFQCSVEDRGEFQVINGPSAPGKPTWY